MSQGILKSNAQLILKSRKVIASPGKYTAKVTSVTPYIKQNASGPATVAIANFNIMTDYHLGVAKGYFTQGDFQEAINQQLSASIRESDFQPSKGETVEIMVENITTNNGVTGLFVTAINAIKASEASSFDMDSFLSDTSMEESVDILAPVQTSIEA